MTKLIRNACLFIILGAAHFVFPDPLSAELILEPLNISRPLPGLNGTLWQTIFTIQNENDVGWTMAGSGCNTSSTVGVEDHSVAHNPVCAGGSAGIVYFLPDELSKLMFFSLRVIDLNSSSQHLGSDLPVVREADALRGYTILTGVPGYADYRHTLRVYNLSTSEIFQFTLRVFRVSDLFNSDPVFETSASLPPAPSETGLAASSSKWDEGQELPDLGGGDEFKFEITPSSPAVPYWFFASVTHKATNALTIVTPH